MDRSSSKLWEIQLVSVAPILFILLRARQAVAPGSQGSRFSRQVFPVWILLGALALCLTLRAAPIALYWNSIDSLWFDFERRGILYRIAQILSHATFWAYLALAAYLLWNMDASAHFWVRSGTLLIAWFGLALLERFPVHKFPRLNRPGLYEGAKVDLITNLSMAVFSGLGMTALSVLYYWWRG